MDWLRGRFWLNFLCSMSLALALPILVRARTFEKAVVNRVINDVYLYDDFASDDPDRRVARRKDILRPNMALRTTSNSRVELVFEDESLLRVGTDAVFSFSAQDREVQLADGTVFFQKQDSNEETRIRTNTMTASLTGTSIFVQSEESAEGSAGGDGPSRFHARVRAERDRVLSLEGEVTVTSRSNPESRKTLEPGQMISVPEGADELPEPREVRLEDIVRTSKLINLDEEEEEGSDETADDESADKSDGTGGDADGEDTVEQSEDADEGTSEESTGEESSQISSGEDDVTVDRTEDPTAEEGNQIEESTPEGEGSDQGSDKQIADPESAPPPDSKYTPSSEEAEESLDIKTQDESQEPTESQDESQTEDKDGSVYVGLMGEDSSEQFVDSEESGDDGSESSSSSFSVEATTITAEESEGNVQITVENQSVQEAVDEQNERIRRGQLVQTDRFVTDQGVATVDIDVDEQEVLAVNDTEQDLNENQEETSELITVDLSENEEFKHLTDGANIEVTGDGSETYDLDDGYSNFVIDTQDPETTANITMDDVKVFAESVAFRVRNSGTIEIGDVTLESQFNIGMLAEGSDGKIRFVDAATLDSGFETDVNLAANNIEVKDGVTVSVQLDGSGATFNIASDNDNYNLGEITEEEFGKFDVDGIVNETSFDPDLVDSSLFEE